MITEINTTDELFALLCEAGASIESLIDSVEASPDDYLLLEKIRAVTAARASMANALKLRVTGAAYRDKLVSEALNLRAQS